MIDEPLIEKDTLAGIKTLIEKGDQKKALIELVNFVETLHINQITSSKTADRLYEVVTEKLLRRGKRYDNLRKNATADNQRNQCTKRGNPKNTGISSRRDKKTEAPVS